LLEADGITIRDELGWPLTTTSMAAPILAWLRAATDDLPRGELFAMLASPFTWGNVLLDDGERTAALRALEQLCERARWSGGWQQLAHAQQRFPALVNQPLQRVLDALGRAINLLTAARRTRLRLADWLVTHCTLLEMLGLTEEALAKDPAGVTLNAVHRAYAGHATSAITFSYDEWQRHYLATLDAAPFNDPDIAASPVVLTTTGAAMGRSFAGVLLLGMTQLNWDNVAQPTQLISNDARLQLRLATRDAMLRRRMLELLTVLSQATHVHLSWQGAHAREPGSLVPWLVPLWNAVTVPPLWQEAQWVPTGAPMLPPAPGVDRAAVPSRLPVAAWQTLLDCPYQFFAARILGLARSEEKDEQIDAAALGEAAHRVLERMHRRFVQWSGVADADLVSAFGEECEKIYAPLAAMDYRVHQAWDQWVHTAPSYIAWQRQREAAGWAYAGGEIVGVLALGERGRDRAAWQLVGRIDRLDTCQGADGSAQWAVIDYKTSRPDGLSEQAAEPDESLQLPAYAALLPTAIEKIASGSVPTATPVVTEAAFVALPRAPDESIKVIGLTEDIPATAQRAINRLQALAHSMDTGARFIANGDVTTCERCFVRGLCRRAWHADPALAVTEPDS
jgi:ATP-dependent helicase/nuclease subunit B